MTEAKTPKAGEHWVHKNGLDIVYFIGLAPSGQMVWQCAGDNVEIGDLDWSGWHHEPRCDSFDWVEPPADVWPKWYVCDSWDYHAYIRRDSKTQIGEIMRKEGVAEYGNRKWEPSDDYNVNRGAFKEVTEAEALARVKPPESRYQPIGYRSDVTCSIAASERERKEQPTEPEFCSACGVHSVLPGTKTCCGCAEYVSLEGTKVGTVKITPVESPDATIAMLQPMEPTEFFDKFHPAESPDDWVEISKTLHPDHVPRKGIDTLLYDHNQNSDAEGRTSVDCNNCNPIGHSTWNYWKWVCRRKDLPTPVPAVKRVPVRMWVHRDSRNDERYNVFVKITPPAESNLYREILCDNDGFFLEATE